MKSCFLHYILPFLVIVLVERSHGFNMTNKTNSTDYYYSPEQIDDCQVALAELNSNPILVIANADYASNMTEACLDFEDPTDACQVDVGLSAATVYLDATMLPQYDTLKAACFLAGGQFCTMVGTATGDISLLGGLLTYGIDMTLIGVANCIPTSCGPEELDEQGDFEHLYSFLFDVLQISAEDVGVTSEITCSMS